MPKYNLHDQKNRGNCKPSKVPIRVGTMLFNVNKNKEGFFSTELFQRYRRSEQAFILALMEMFIKGLSTPKLIRVTEELCGTRFTASIMSDLCKNIDSNVAAWNERNLSGKSFPFLILNALPVKIRVAGQIRPCLVQVVVGINDEGYREILGMQLAGSDDNKCWLSLFAWLKKRGLHGINLIISAEYKGLVKAVKTYFQEAEWHYHQKEFIKNILDVCPRQLQREFNERLSALLNAPDVEAAEMFLEGIRENFLADAPEAVNILARNFQHAVVVFKLPKRYRERLSNTNTIETLNRETGRRERVIRIFPSRASANRVIGTLLIEQHEKWSTGRQYFNMDEYWNWRKQEEAKKQLIMKKSNAVIIA